MISRRSFLKRIGATALVAISAPLYIPAQHLEFGVPRRILTAIDPGWLDTHPLIPEETLREIVKATRKESAVLSMFKQRTMSTMQQRMPVLSNKPTAYFVTGDTGLIQTTSMTWENTFLNAEEIAAIVPIAESTMPDQDYDLWS